MDSAAFENIHSKVVALLESDTVKQNLQYAERYSLAFAKIAANLVALLVSSVTYYITTAELTDLLRDVALIVVVGHILAPIEDSIIKYGVWQTIRFAFRASAKYIFQVILSLPIVRGQIQKQVAGVLSKIEEDMIERKDTLPDFHSIPEKHYKPQEIMKTLDKFTTLKQSDWESGKLSGAVYHGGAELRKLQTEVWGSYAFANQLHPDCFPAVRRMDSEAVQMVLDLYNGPEGSCGTTTSGGTESLLLTCLAARELAKATRGITEFEIIAPTTVHAGIDKAAYYFGMKLVHAPLNPKTMQVDLNSVKKLIGPNTVLLVGSAPNYPHGIMDDIEGLGKIAQANDLPLHVDCCLGSFIVPFLEELNNDKSPEKRIKIPKFDFRVPGVTSISCDTHKYGFAPKGSSVIMYRTPELRRFQYFVNTDWTGGLYASPTLAGSRPGALVAACWATMLYMGRDGYKESAKEIIYSTQRIKEGILAHPELYFVYGDPIGSVVAFGSNKISVYDLSDALSKRGWHLATLQNPPAIHMASTTLTKGAVDHLIKDLVEVGNELLAQGSSAQNTEGTKALYGVAGSVKTSGVAGRLAEGFIDFLYTV